MVFFVVSAPDSGLPANVGIELDRYELGFRWISIITCRVINPCVWLLVLSGEASESAWGTGSVSRPSRRFWMGDVIVSGCGSRIGP